MEIADRLSTAITRLQRRLRRADAEGASALPPARMAVLGILAVDGGQSPGALARREQVTPPTMTRVLQGLEQSGLVKRRRDELDRRAVRMEITRKGRSALDHARMMHRDELRMLVGLLAARDVEVLGESAAVIDRMLAGKKASKGS